MNTLIRCAAALSLLTVVLLPTTSLAKKTGGKPKVEITFPANMATESTVVTIDGTASDRLEITSIAISIDGGTYEDAAGSDPWTYSWNTMNFANGVHSITAQVTDSAGDTATSTIHVSVDNPLSLPIQPDFFGLDVSNTTVQWPSAAGVPFGSVRLWDSGTRWNQIETSKGTYTWTALDALVSAANQNGQTVLYTFGGDPTFYSSNPTDTNCTELATGDGPCDPPADVNSNGSGTDADFQSFVTALMQHLQQRGETIQYFEIWNEVNNYQAFWNGTAAQLVRMAADARAIIKSYDSNALVLTPNTCNCNNTHFTAGAHPTSNPQDAMSYYLNTKVKLPSGHVVTGASVADGITFHPYLGSPNPEGIVNLITEMQGLMAADGLSNLPLIDSESSWGLNTHITSCPASPPFAQNCLNNMTAFLPRSYILAASNGLTRFYWYQWGNNSWGTLYDTSDGSIYEPAEAYAGVEEWLLGSSFEGPCQQSDTIYTCNLVSAGGVTEEIVWNTSGPATFNTWPYTQCATVTGSACKVNSGVVTIGTQPILLTP